MSNRQSNKEFERRSVEVFKLIFKDFPAGEIIANEAQERPDTLVVTAQGKLGIEVTRINTQALKREESEVEAAIDEARSIYEKQNLPSLHVSVHVGDGKTFNRKNRRAFATAIATLVSKNIPTQDSSVFIDNDWADSNAFPIEINSINIYRFAKLSRNHWTRPEAGFFRSEFIAELQNIISGKDKLLTNYNQDCSAHWLLIIAENGSPSTLFDPSAATLSHLYKSAFSRVFFMDLFSRKLSELKLTST